MKINDVAHFSLLMETNTYILQTHTQRQYYEVQVVFWVILRSTPLQYTKYTPGKGGYVVFWEKYEVLRPAPLPPKTGHPQACPTRVVVRTKSPTVEDRHRQEHARRGKTAEQQQQSLHYRYFYPYEYVVRFGPILTNTKYCCTFRMYVEERLYRKGERRV